MDTENVMTFSKSKFCGSLKRQKKILMALHLMRSFGHNLEPLTSPRKLQP